jgi:hypothetical protein
MIAAAQRIAISDENLLFIDSCPFCPATNETKVSYRHPARQVAVSSTDWLGLTVSSCVKWFIESINNVPFVAALLYSELAERSGLPIRVREGGISNDLIRL